MAESYQEAIQRLKDRYNLPRATHHEHVRSIPQASTMKSNNDTQLQKLYDVCEQRIRAIKLLDHHRDGIEDGQNNEAEVDRIQQQLSNDTPV